ncbi:Peptidoglycan recognition protein [Eumeta japonica]|uniref:Peptidoglycan recognition protein n=1 Tax=Eumeta variegata TaxID=151549 RepID=A0A4C1TU32_EUMVA|nr:Peptidoglycan recognition protein [Eumeta japonica]
MFTLRAPGYESKYQQDKVVLFARGESMTECDIYPGDKRVDQLKEFAHLGSFFTSKCGEVTIKEWGGEKPRSVEYLPRPVDLVIVQHTVTPECSTDQQCADRVKSIQSYHIDQLHFDNIGSKYVANGAFR